MSKITSSNDGTLSIETNSGPITLRVSSDMPSDAQMLCSAPDDLKPYPRSQMHVLPGHANGRYVTTFRCDKHWKAALAETRARFAANPNEDEAVDILMFIVDHGVSEDRLAEFVRGKRLAAAVSAALDAIESGQLVLSP